MKKLLPFIFVVFITSLSYPQSGWYQVNILGSNDMISSIQFTSANTGYATSSTSAEQSQFLKTTNGGYNWQATPFPYYFLGNMYFLDDNTGFVTAQYNSSTVNSIIFKTTNGGINWVAKDSMYYIYKLKFFDHNTGFVVAPFSVVCKTTNCGENWIQQHSGAVWDRPRDLCCIDADNWLVTSSDIVGSQANTLNKTTNGGINWSVLDFGGPGGMYFKYLSFVNSTTGFNAYTNNNTVISKTTNTGVDWTPINTFPTFTVSYQLNFVNDNTGYLIGNSPTGGICKTTDGGYNWTRQMTNPNVRLYVSYFFNSYSGFVAGDNGIIFKTTNGGVAFVNNTSSEIPSAYFLSQNYPNPFNPSTTIKFSIPENGKYKNGIVSLKVYDILGKEVATLVNESLKPGTYKTTFDGSNLSSGIYFYKLIAGDYSETKRLTLLK